MFQVKGTPKITYNEGAKNYYSNILKVQKIVANYRIDLIKKKITVEGLKAKVLMTFILRIL